MRWSEEEIKVLKELHKEGKNSAEIAQVLKRTQKAVLHQLARLKSITQSRTSAYLITSDWHIPHYDREAFSFLLETAKKKRIEKIIIAGDFLNLDILSSYAKTEAITIDQELTEAKAVIKTLLNCFNEIHIIPGNHERRIIRRLNTPLSFVSFFSMIHKDERIKTTEKDHLVVSAGGRAFRICHPKNYSRVKLSVAVQLADIYHQNIVAGHSHSLGITFSRSASFLCIDCGGMFDESKIEYIQATSTHPEWNQGFVALYENKVELYSLSPTLHISWKLPKNT